MNQSIPNVRGDKLICTLKARKITLVFRNKHSTRIATIWWFREPQTLESHRGRPRFTSYSYQLQSREILAHFSLLHVSFCELYVSSGFFGCCSASPCNCTRSEHWCSLKCRFGSPHPRQETLAGSYFDDLEYLSPGHRWKCAAEHTWKPINKNFEIFARLKIQAKPIFGSK